MRSLVFSVMFTGAVLAVIGRARPIRRATD